MLKLRRILRNTIFVFVSLYVLGSIAGGIFLAEFTLHPTRRPLYRVEQFRSSVRSEFNTALEGVSITAADGVALRGWYVQPARFNGDVVLLLHGVTDTRAGMIAFGHLFLKHGYAVLLPDARAHGQSSGPIATYGVLERDDVHRWVSWIYQRRRPGCVFGLGESMGAATIVQALQSEPRLCAIVAESPFATFRDAAYSRFAQHSGLGLWFGKSIARPGIETGLLYARLRYGVDLTRASGVDAVRDSRTPVLLVHGALDRNIWPVNSRIIHAAVPSRTQLWIVPGALHTGAWKADSAAFESRVLEWYAAHRSLPHAGGAT